MKKRLSKKICKVLSVFLAFLIVVQILPLQVLAESVTDAIAHQQFINDVVNNPVLEDNNSDAEILYEVEEKRDEYTKVYKKSDGTYTAIFCKEPIHYLDDGMWKEIDNTLFVNQDTYTNANNIFNVIFPKSLDNDSAISIDNGNSEIAFKVNNIDESIGVIENCIGESDMEIDDVEHVIANTQSCITYEDVNTNTDIQYIVTPNSIKENVIISNKNNVKDSYSFIINKGNLVYNFENDGSISFKNDNNSIEFSIPRPVMTDSAFAISYDINVTVVDNNNGSIELVYSPSRTWTDSADRVYPISIDPVICVESSRDNWIVDNCVIDDSTNATDQDENFHNDFIGFVANTTQNNDNNETDTLNAEIYTKINPNIFKGLGENIVFTDVQYVLAGGGYGGKIIAKEVSEPYDMQTITYKTKPDHGEEIYDYYTTLFENEADADANSEGLVFIHFNITKPFNDWLSGDTNNGFVMVPEKEGTTAMLITDGVYSYTNPTTGSTTTTKYTTSLVVDYVDINGYNDLYNYHSQTVGRAGTGYVNDFTQQLSVIRDDLSIDGNIMPVTISMNYGTAVSNMFEYSYSFQNPYGTGWSSNYHRMCKIIDNYQVIYYTDTGSEISFNLETDNDGNINFYESNAEYVGESGYALEFITETNLESGVDIRYAQITRPDGYIERFNQNGFLVSIFNPDYPDQTIKVEYENTGFIDCVIDGVGRKYDFTYDNNGMLSKICCFSLDGTQITAGSTSYPLEVHYTYTNELLTEVTYPDGQSVYYDYDLDNHLVSIENIDGYRIVYEYDKNGKVINVKEQAKSGTNYIDGNFIKYETLTANQVKLVDAFGSTEVYQFNHYGKLLYIVDSNGNYCNHNLETNNATFTVATSDFKADSQNLLIDPSFENNNPKLLDYLSAWDNNSNFTIIESDDAHSGSKVMQISSDRICSNMQIQTVEVNNGGKYTFSAYVKSSSNPDGKLSLKITAIDDSNNEFVETVNINSTGDNWQRYTVTIDAPNNAEEIVVSFGFDKGLGTFLVDSIQLEHSVSASEFNLIENGSFTNNDKNWVKSNDFEIVNSTIFDENIKALQLDGGVCTDNTVYTTIAINGKKGDIYSVGGWLKGIFTTSENTNSYLNLLEKDQPDIFNFTKDRFAQIEVSYQYKETNGEGIEEFIKETIVVPFEAILTDWQFASNSFFLKGDCEEIIILIRYEKNINSALITKLQLVSNEDVTTDTTSLEENEPVIKENESVNYCACGIKCNYGVDCPCSCETLEECKCITCHRQRDMKISDTFGNTCIKRSFDGIRHIESSFTYTENGNYLSSKTDEDNNTIYYHYDTLNGFLDSIVDAQHNTTNYDYNAYGLLMSVSTLNEKKLTSSVQYTYTKDKLTKISHNGFDYVLTYDMWGQLVMVSIENQPIISYEYGNGKYRDRLKNITYFNGSENTKIKYFYDANGNLSRIDINNHTKYVCHYDTLGEVVKVVTLENKTICYTNGRTDILDNSNNIIYSSYINDDGNIIEIVDGVEYITKKYDNSYDALTGITTEKCDVISGDRVVGNVAKQDWFGRYTESTIKTEGANDSNSENVFSAIKTEYTYSEYDNKTSNRVETYINKVYNGINTNSDNYKSYNGYCYDYDVNGNVIAEYDLTVGGTKTLRYSYMYDDLNQLVRVNDAVAQKSYTYTYDGSGNILTKTTYPYSINELGTATETLNYTYDSTWKDKLMSYGTTNIEYDDIGNPTKIGDENFYWSGRQLDSYVLDNKTITFEYDENGLRHRKTVKENNIVIETYDYVWSEDSLISQTYIAYSNGEVSSINTAKFIYDAWGILQGFILNDTSTFLYTKNLQGDILSIVNESGRTILTYSYDAWGVVNFASSSMSDMMLAYTLSFVSPFTYRSYCYDYDIELYYLQSRYYSPKIGRFINADSTDYLGATGTTLSYNLFTYCENNPVNRIDELGNSSVKFLNNTYVKYKGKTINYKTLAELLVSNGKNFYNAFHEFAQVVIAQKLYKSGYSKIELEKKCSDNKHEMDVYGYKNKTGYMWEVKPKGTSAESQLKLYTKLNPTIKRGKSLGTIKIEVCKNLNMKITFDGKGGAFYSFYNSKGKQITNAELKKAIQIGIYASAGLTVAAITVAVILSVWLSGGTATVPATKVTASAVSSSTMGVILPYAIDAAIKAAA